MDELLAQALDLVSEDKRGELADIIEAMVGRVAIVERSFWLTRIYDWDPTPGTDAIFYAIYGRATRNSDEAHQVYELVNQSRVNAVEAQHATQI